MPLSVHDAKEQVRDATDIVDLVGAYLDLRRQGRHFVGLCPWHDDTRPSLQVNPQRQTWRCWVCNDGGDVFSFVMKRDGVGFREALGMLAERAGILLHTRPAGPVDESTDKQTLFRANAWAEAQYHECLLHGEQAEPARRYLVKRGMSPAAIGRFRLGYSPDSWQWLLDRARSAGFSDAVLGAAGLSGVSQTSKRPFDRFRGRLMFPIHDTLGRVAGFGARRLADTADEPTAKYINSPESIIFAKSDLLYGIDIVRDAVSRRREAVVVEGYTDAIMAWQFGVDNVLAALGTAIGERHIRMLRRFADRVTLVLDGDAAGQQRTAEILELFVENPIDLRIVTLPSGLDPCDFLQQHGAAAFQELLDSAPDALDYRIQLATRGIDLMRDVHAANQALEGVLRTLARFSPTATRKGSQYELRHRQIISHLARVFHVGELDLRTRLRELHAAAKAGTRSVPEGSTAVDRLDDWDRECLLLVIRHPEFAGRVRRAVEIDDLQAREARSIYAAYCQLFDAGQPVDFARLMLALEDGDLKGLLVELDTVKRSALEEDPEMCLEALVEAYRRRREERVGRGQIGQLEEAQLDDKVRMSIFEDFLRRQRERRGLLGPTDG